MPSTRPTVDPVLDILEELGYDFDELDGDGYKRSIREAIFKTHPDTGGKTADPEKFQILNEEFKKIRRGGPKPSDIKVKEKNTTISPAKFLPGTTFRPEDIESNESDDSSVANITVVDRLNNIAEALNVIGGLFKTQLNILQDQEEEDRLDEAENKKKLRESKLEKKDDKKKKSLIKMPKPVTNFFDKLQRFFVNVALGAATLKFVEWFKDPANREKILAFTNFIKDNAKAIFTTLAAIVALNFVANLIGILSTLKIIAAIVLNPWVLATLGILALGKLAAPLLNTDKIGENLGESTEKSTQALVKEGMDEADARVLSESVTNTTANKAMDQNLRAPTDMLQIRSYNDPLSTGMGRYAKGGRPPVGEVATVGEQGRELFIADTPGTIVSNNKTENVFNGGALLVAKSDVIDKASSISQKVGKKRTPNLIDLRGKSKGSSPNPTFSTGGQIEGVSSVDNSNIDLYSSSLLYGLTGAN